MNKQYCTFFLVCYSMVLMWWLFLEKHSTVHKADDILQLLFPSKKQNKKNQIKSRLPDTLDAPAWTSWSKAAGVDTTPSLPERSRIRRFALEEGRVKKRSELSLDASVADGGDL